jgi:hypothetical protein
LEIIELNAEVVLHHTELNTELCAALQGNGEIETYYGVLAAYCGIALDGSYVQKDLIASITKPAPAPMDKNKL